jgi:endonuclease YncB( thermonuclease family)
MTKRYLLALLVLSLMMNVHLALELSRVERVGKMSQETPPVSPTPKESLPSGESYPFIRVVDGDTITVGVAESVEYVRLIGIDAPEPNDPGGPECYATESTAHLTELLQTGTVRLFFDSSQGLRDKYSRLLAYAELPDGTDVGYAMVRNGYAREYLYDTSYQRRDAYLEAEKNAVTEQQGLWNDAVCK